MRINEIFRSIDGECNHWGQGSWSTFIRTQGCNLKCSYCDTPQAQTGWEGERLVIPQIIDKVEELGVEKVTITGGEPLYQQDTIYLVKQLYRLGYKISIETNGSQPIEKYVGLANIVMDYKLPSSGQERFMELDNFWLLKSTDYIKFVIGNVEDYERAKEIVTNRKKCLAKMAFSPTIPGCDPKALMEMMEKDKLFDVQVNIQIHKLVGAK